MNEEKSKVQVMDLMQDYMQEYAIIISRAVFEKKAKQSVLHKYIMRFATIEQLKVAMNIFFELVNAKDLLEVIRPAKIKYNDDALSIGGNSILGIINLFMENLHLSRVEVFEIIPYPILLAMNADKLRSLPKGEGVTVDSGDQSFRDGVQINKISGREMMARKNGGR